MEEILVEEQAGFQAGRKTIEHVFRVRAMVVKHLQHSKALYHNFVGFRRAFDGICHKGLWNVLRSYSVDEGLILNIKALYDGSRSSVLLNSQVGESFPTTVGVCQGCLLSLVLFNIYLEKVMRNKLEDHKSSILIRGRPSNLLFAEE